MRQQRIHPIITANVIIIVILILLLILDPQSIRACSLAPDRPPKGGASALRDACRPFGPGGGRSAKEP